MNYRKTILNKRKQGKRVQSQDTAFPPTKQSQPSLSILPMNQSFVQCESEVGSVENMVLSSKMVASILKEHEYQTSGRPTQNQNIRPNIDVVNDVLERKYTKNVIRYRSETILFISILIWLFNVCTMNWMWLELCTSIYFSYDSIKKLKIMENEFHINCVMHVVSGPFQLLIDIAYYYRYRKLYWFSSVLKSFKMFSSNYQLQNLQDIYSALFNSLPVVFTATIIFSIFSYYFTIHYSSINQKYFKDFGTSAFTLLQVLTLDNWGDILEELDSKLETVLLIFFFITILSMFFWFLIQAFQIDIMILDELVRQNKVYLQIDMVRSSSNQQILIRQNNGIYELFYGMYYTRILLVIFVINLFLIEQQKKQTIDFHIFTLLVSVLYTMHFMALLFMDKQKILRINSEYKKLQLAFHLISGPIALACYLCKQYSLRIDEIIFLQHSSIAPLLLMIKLVTNSNTRDISYIVLIVLLQSFPPYLTMITLTYLFIGLTNQGNQDIMSSLLSYLRIMTLDNWDESFHYYSHDQYLGAVGMIAYILVCQFLLIPSFMAQACQIFQTILGVQFKAKVTQDIQYNIFDPALQNTEQKIIKKNKQEKSSIEEAQDLIYLLLKSEKHLFDESDQQSIRTLKLVYQYLNSEKYLAMHSPKDCTQKEMEFMFRLKKCGYVKIIYKDHSREYSQSQLKANFK